MDHQQGSLPSKVEVVTLNCWGLKYISKHRYERLSEIGAQLASRNPAPHIVGLQECWTQQDYEAIRRQTSDILPHGKFYYGGIFGAGLVILSRWPIIESSMVEYPLNGRPTAFFRGDWFVGKGVACAKVQFGKGQQDIMELFCTHLHAPYEREPHDSYICHRTAQAWEIAKLMRGAVERGHLTVALGDFNMIPSSLAHQLITTHSLAEDVWRVVHPDSSPSLSAETTVAGSVAADVDESTLAKTRGTGIGHIPTAMNNLTINGTTCDSVLNTWRWEKAKRQRLGKGGEDDIPTTNENKSDPRAKRLDYIFVGQPRQMRDNHSVTTRKWSLEKASVGMTMRHPTLKCSLSDHFSVEATLSLNDDHGHDQPNQPPEAADEPTRFLPVETYSTILSMIFRYTSRELTQRKWRLRHFIAQTTLTIGCHIGIWWVCPRDYVAFILMFFSTFGFAAGLLDGLIGGLFIASELRALKEFEWEIRNVWERAKDAEAGSAGAERVVGERSLTEKIERAESRV